MRNTKKLFSPEQIKLISEHAWLGLDDPTEFLTYESPIHHGIFDESSEEVPIPLLKTICNPEYFYFFCKEVLNITIHPFQGLILRELWTRPFPMLIASRGASKTFSLALFSVLRALLIPNSKVVICGAGFRQSKLVFDYIEKITGGSSIYKEMAGSRFGIKRYNDRISCNVNDSVITGLPIGTGEKIRGERATDLIVDEFNSVPEEIFEVVMRGFASVTQDPIENIKKMAAHRAMQNLGIDTGEAPEIKGNRIIIAGTSGYSFQHFYKYFCQYRGIIRSKGDREKIAMATGGKVPDNLHWKDHSIIRIPVDLIPEGFMDIKQIAQAKASTHSSAFQIEYGTVFAKDSNGFFKRKVIEQCVANPSNKIEIPGYPAPLIFHGILTGSPAYPYYMGIDPAAESDNFAIIILEGHPNHRRVVYSWTTNRQRYKDALARKKTDSVDYFAFCCRKILDLVQKFNIKRIGIDAEGGGRQIIEMLGRTDWLATHEMPLYEAVEDGKPKPTDNLAGLKILERIIFRKTEWVSEANHTLKAELENKTLLFPFYDSISIEMAAIDDAAQSPFVSDNDTLEDCVIEIEELKDELASIVYTQTGAMGLDHWDVPEQKLAGGKKGRMRKDRYSSLLIANMMAKRTYYQLPEPVYNAYGGFAEKIKGSDLGEGGYLCGPEWFMKAADYL